MRFFVFIAMQQALCKDLLFDKCGGECFLAASFEDKMSLGDGETII